MLNLYFFLTQPLLTVIIKKILMQTALNVVFAIDQVYESMVYMKRTLMNVKMIAKILISLNLITIYLAEDASRFIINC